MTPAEQRVLDAARAYRDTPDLGTRECFDLLAAANQLPRTWPPPTVTDNPAEVVQGKVREQRTNGRYYFVRVSDAGALARVRPTAVWFSTLGAINGDRLVSRPGVDL